MEESQLFGQPTPQDEAIIRAASNRPSHGQSGLTLAKLREFRQRLEQCEHEIIERQFICDRCCTFTSPSEYALAVHMTLCRTETEIEGYIAYDSQHEEDYTDIDGMTLEEISAWLDKEHEWLQTP